MRTAWSDKHAIYTSFNGHGSGGKSIDDFFGPEIDSQAVEPNGVPYPTDTDWAHDDAATKQYDGYKVQAVINEMDGYDHAVRHKVGTPAIFGMNFQAVSVAEKVDSPEHADRSERERQLHGGLRELAGYQPVTGTTPRPAARQRARLRQRSARQRMVTTIQKDGLAGSTTIIVTAKHGQSPQDPNELRSVKDGPIISAINAAWAQTHPSNTSTDRRRNRRRPVAELPVGQARRPLADFVKSYLWNHTARRSLQQRRQEPRITVQHSGLAQIWAGA